MRKRDGTLPPKKTYEEIMEDLNSRSEDFKKTMFYKRLVRRAGMLRDAELSEENEHA